MSMDINKLLVPKMPTSTGIYSIDSLSLSTYRNMPVGQSWIKSFADGSNQLSDLKLSLGLEFKFNNSFMFRSGYHYEAKNVGNKSYFTFGAGLNTDTFEFNFAYIAPISVSGNRSPLLNTLTFGIVFNLN